MIAFHELHKSTGFAFSLRLYFRRGDLLCLIRLSRLNNPSPPPYPVLTVRCLQDYRGPSAASEAETQAIMGFLRAPHTFSHPTTGTPFNATFSIAFNFHSYAKYGGHHSVTHPNPLWRSLSPLFPSLSHAHTHHDPLFACAFHPAAASWHNYVVPQIRKSAVLMPAARGVPSARRHQGRRPPLHPVEPLGLRTLLREGQ